MSESLDPFLAPTWFVDFDHPEVAAVAHDVADGVDDEVERACRLFYAVRDGIRYSAYNIDLRRSAFRASAVLAAGTSWCVAKSVLLAAVCRSAGLPCRLGYADVCNHLATKRLTEAMGTNIFYYHGFNEIFLRGRWVKATVAFNRTLCEKARIAPLDFDGVHDSIYHPLDLDGRQYMEYLHDYGSFADVPYEALMTRFDEKYPHSLGRRQAARAANAAEAAGSSDFVDKSFVPQAVADFEADVEAEAKQQ